MDQRLYFYLFLYQFSENIKTIQSMPDEKGGGVKKRTFSNNPDIHF